MGWASGKGGKGKSNGQGERAGEGHVGRSRCKGKGKSRGKGKEEAINLMVPRINTCSVPPLHGLFLTCRRAKYE